MATNTEIRFSRNTEFGEQSRAEPLCAIFVKCCGGRCPTESIFFAPKDASATEAHISIVYYRFPTATQNGNRQDLSC